MNKQKTTNPPSILIVDDNLKNLQVLGGLLQKEGMSVEFALDGVSALDWLDKKRFDLVLFLPKDIVSGDFYWFCEVDHILVIAVMDCTGHGVPGAFMSILGMTLLDEIVLKKKIHRPDKILEKLRLEIISSLGQDSVEKEVSDGMEGSVICYDQNKEILRYSGSYNPLLLINNSEISEIKADRIPVCYSIIHKEFSLHEIEIKQNDVIYLFSDGYADQFGGPEKKKFMRKRLMGLLYENYELPLQTQKKLLRETFNQWKGDMEQTDDVVVMGIKF